MDYDHLPLDEQHQAIIGKIENLEREHMDATLSAVESDLDLPGRAERVASLERRILDVRKQRDAVEKKDPKLKGSRRNA